MPDDFCPTESLMRIQIQQAEYLGRYDLSAKIKREWAEHKRTCTTCNPAVPSLAEQLFGLKVAK